MKLSLSICTDILRGAQVFIYRTNPQLHTRKVSVLVYNQVLHWTDFGELSPSIYKDNNDHCLFSLSTYYGPDTGLSTICINPFNYRNTPLPKMGAAAAKSLQLCPTLCDRTDGSPPGSPVPGILQARTLEWVAISFSNAWKWKVKVKLLRLVWLSATPWTAAYQAPPSMGYSRQEYWSGVPFPSPKKGLIIGNKTFRISFF